MPTKEAEKKCPLKAAPGRVIVEPKEPKTVSEGGIVLPAIAQEKVNEGVVIDHSPGPQQLKKMEVYNFQPGEFVIWSKYAGKPYRVGEIEYKILAEEDIEATIPEEGK